MKEHKIGKHIVTEHNGNIYCDCTHGLIHHGNWNKGEPCCKHIKIIVEQTYRKENEK